MTQEKIDAIKHMKWKGYVSDEDATVLWSTYEELYGPFPGCKGCGENKREAVKKLIIYIETL